MAGELEKLTRLAASNRIDDPDRDDAGSQPQFPPARDDSAGAGSETESVQEAYREAKTRYLAAKEHADYADLRVERAWIGWGDGYAAAIIRQKATPLREDSREASASVLQWWKQILLRVFSWKNRNP